MPKEEKKADDKCCCGHEKALSEIKKIGDELSILAKKAKKRYDQADNKTKKTIIAAIAGAGALIAGAIGIKAARDKKKK